MTYEEFMPHWKKQDQCFEDEQVEMVDTLHDRKLLKSGKQVVKAWPHDKFTAQISYENWLEKVVNQILTNSIQQGTNKEIRLREPEPSI